MKNYIYLSFVSILLFANSANAQKVNYLSVPGYNELSKIDTNAYSVLPSGRYVKPAGQAIRISHDPFGLAISPDQKVAITMHENAITIIDLASMQQKRIPEYKKNAFNPLKKGSFLGVAFHANKNIVYLSGGDEGSVVIYDYVAHKKIAEFWNVYLKIRKEPESAISPVDVANMMILLKLARHTETPKKDNYTDIAGYAYCASEILGI